MREIVKMTLIERETPGAIKTIWNEYHSSRPANVSTVISANQFDILSKRGATSPYFIFPVRRESGYFLLLVQSQSTTNMFTYLEDFKKSPGSATPYFVLTLFEEIKLKKGIIPVRGDIIDFKISRKEANTLMQAFLAHFIEGGLYEETVHVFNHEPARFNHDAYIEQYFNRFP